MTRTPDPEVDPSLGSAVADALDYARNLMADRGPSMPDAAPGPDMPSADLDAATDEGLI